MIGAALIGHTGFVGGTLARSAPFDACFNSSNIGDLRGRHTGLLVCAGVSAVKWRANQDPAADRANIARLTDVLATATADELVLISTVDVYPEPDAGCDEDSPLDATANHAYGRHRLELETWCRERFPTVRVVRLPALFGTGLRKNALYDLLHGHMLGNIDPRAIFQWYPLDRLWDDIGVVRRARLERVNLVPEPLPMQAILDTVFPSVGTGVPVGPAPHYDVHTRHARLFGSAGRYIMDREASLAAIARFVAAERG